MSEEGSDRKDNDMIWEAFLEYDYERDGHISVNDLKKAMGDKLLIEDLSFTVPPGAIVGVIGVGNLAVESPAAQQLREAAVDLSRRLGATFTGLAPVASPATAS